MGAHRCSGGADIATIDLAAAYAALAIRLRPTAASIAVVVMLVIGMLVSAVARRLPPLDQQPYRSGERDWCNARYDGITGLLNGFGLENSRRRLPAQKGANCRIAPPDQLDGQRYRRPLRLPRCRQRSTVARRAIALLEALADGHRKAIRAQVVLAPLRALAELAVRCRRRRGHADPRLLPSECCQRRVSGCRCRPTLNVGLSGGSRCARRSRQRCIRLAAWPKPASRPRS